MNRFKSNFLWIPILLLTLATLPFISSLLSNDPVGSVYPDTDLDYFLRLHNMSFKSSTFFPQWNPLDICGAPLLSESQCGTFYPLNQIFRWMPLFKAVTFFFWIHTLLIMFFMYFLARHLGLSVIASILSALSFSCCGHWVLGIYAGKLSNIATITWLPLQLILICRIKQNHNVQIFICMGFVFALQFFAGHFQYMYYSLLVIFFFYQYCWFKSQEQFQMNHFVKAQINFMIALIVGLLISLPHLIPIIDYLLDTYRNSLTMAQVGHFSFPIHNLLTLLVPGIYGDMQNVEYWGIYNLWEMCAYVGIMPLLLCLYAIKKGLSSWMCFFCATAIIALIMALGHYTPFFNVFFYALPGMTWFRGHSKAIVIFCLCVSLMAGKGLDDILSNQQSKPKSSIFILIMIISIAFLLIWTQTQSAISVMKTVMSHIINQPGRYLPIPSITQLKDGYLLAIKGSISNISKGLLWLALSLWLIHRSYRWNVNWRCIIIMMISIIELMSFAHLYVQPVDSSHFMMNEAIQEFFSQDASNYRILDLTNSNTKKVSRIQTITGDRPYIWNRYSRFMNDIVFHHPVPGMKLPPIDRMYDEFQLMNVKYIIQKTNRTLPCQNCIRRYTDSHVDIYENLDVLDRVFIPESVKWISQNDPFFKFLNDKEILNGKCVIIENLESQSKKQTSFDTKQSTVEILKYNNDEIILRAEMTSPGFIVLNDSWSKGWQAICDHDQNLDIYIANYLFRAVFVSKGIHEIQFICLPSGFILSLIIASTTLGLSLMIIVFFGWIAKHKPGV